MGFFSHQAEALHHEACTTSVQRRFAEAHQYFQNTSHSSCAHLRHISKLIGLSVLNYVLVLIFDLLIFQITLREQLDPPFFRTLC